MVFSTYTFILCFFPLVMLIYFGVAKYSNRKAQSLILTLASLIFYAYSDLAYFKDIDSLSSILTVCCCILLFVFGNLLLFNQCLKQLPTTQKYICVLFVFLLNTFILYLFYSPFVNTQKGISSLSVILLSIIVNYSFALFQEKEDDVKLRKALFIFIILFNVLLLGYYKYTIFFVRNLDGSGGLDTLLNQWLGTNFKLVFDRHFYYIILPLGISFFTFQQIAYQISIKNKEESVPPFLDYALFISFFPQLVAGPIVLSKDLINQYQSEERRFFNWSNFSKGLFIFSIGLFKKVVLADTIAIVANNGFHPIHVPSLSFGGAWVASLSYTMQIYFDFSGYSDMAIGLAKMMNIDLPINFYSPYRSKSITEFWKRWHITLGRSLAILVYYPLGGNRKGVRRTYVNLFLVFLVSGIWHGAAWTFIFWGVMHGILRVIEKKYQLLIDKIPTIIRVIFVFLFVNTAWVLFRSNSLDNAFTILKKMYQPSTISFDGIGALAVDGILNYPNVVHVTFIAILLSALFIISIFVKTNSIDMYDNFKPTLKYSVFVAVLFFISILHMSKEGAFIYFNF